ncbi:MAG: DUF488 family protein, partial [Bacteroidota bacterium]
GHGNKPFAFFLNELRSFNIKFLVDVRSKPYSKWNPQFNKHSLEKELEKHDIKYVFLGDSLGGMPEDRSCYDQDGKVIYERIKEKDSFKKGLERLVTANEKDILIAIMCSEANPLHCHRSKLIGAQLLSKENISINHIVGENKIKSQEMVMSEITRGKGNIDLFCKKNYPKR